MLTRIRDDLRRYAKSEKITDLLRFFKTGPGDYGEGDKFLGVMVPDTRKVVHKYWRDATLADITPLLHSEWHEERLLALLILVERFAHGDDKSRENIFEFYLQNTRFINNWDLVDLSCYKIIGNYIYNNPSKKNVFDRLVESDLLWDRRIAVVGSYYFIQQGNPETTLYLVQKVLGDSNDLIQKANGWMLREIGKRIDSSLLISFLKEHYPRIPRMTLRYAIERLQPEMRKRILIGDFD